MEQVGYGTQTKYEVVDKTLLYDKLNVEKGYGQVTGTGETALSGGNTTAEDRIQIGDKIFYLGESNAKQFLGYNVLYYARIDKTSDEKTNNRYSRTGKQEQDSDHRRKDIVAATGDARTKTRQLNIGQTKMTETPKQRLLPRTQYSSITESIRRA